MNCLEADLHPVQEPREGTERAPGGTEGTEPPSAAQIPGWAVHPGQRRVRPSAGLSVPQGCGKQAWGSRAQPGESLGNVTPRGGTPTPRSASSVSPLCPEGTPGSGGLWGLWAAPALWLYPKNWANPPCPGTGAGMRGSGAEGEMRAGLSR